MEDNTEFPEESMRHIEALLSRHNPQMIQRMFQSVIESRRNSTASSHTTSSYTTSSNSSFRSSRLSVASSFSTASSAMSDIAPSVASSRSSVRSGLSGLRRPEPRSYPSGLDPTRPRPALLTPSSETSSPLDMGMEPNFTPTEEDMNSIASPVTFQSEKSQSQAGDSFMFCTYCAELSTLKTFKAKSDWKKHEMRMHETGEDWPCPVPTCTRIFDRQKDFIKHHQRYHSGRPLPSVTDIGIKLLPRRVFGCGFDKCKDVSIGWDERCDHVAKHMKNGASPDQWKYSNVIRNLIRQEALHDTWKDLFASLDERLKESRSQISWSPDNTRILRQKLQCCDLRPSREEVLITALSLRSDLPLDTVQFAPPPGFITPSRDSVPNVDQLSREGRMHILIGNPNISLSRTRLAAVNAALLQACSSIPNFGSFEESPVTEEAERRISYMDLDPVGDMLDVTQTQPGISPLPPNMESPIIEGQQPQDSTYGIDPVKPANPLNWCYPNYFDSAPSFEESPYYDRPSTFGQMLSKPLQRIGSRLSSRHSSPHSRPSSHADPSDIGTDFPIQHPIHHQQPPPHPLHPSHPSNSPHPLHPSHPSNSPHPSHQPHAMGMRQQYRSPDGHPHDQLHLFTSQS